MSNTNTNLEQNVLSTVAEDPVPQLDVIGTAHKAKRFGISRFTSKLSKMVKRGKSAKRIIRDALDYDYTKIPCLKKLSALSVTEAGLLEKVYTDLRRKDMLNAETNFKKFIKSFCRNRQLILKKDTSFEKKYPYLYIFLLMEESEKSLTAHLKKKDNSLIEMDHNHDVIEAYTYYTKGKLDNIDTALSIREQLLKTKSTGGRKTQKRSVR